MRSITPSLYCWKDFSRTFKAIADEYEHYAETYPSGAPTASAKLYVREIRSGSIIADLVAQTPAAVALTLPFVENAKSVVEFAKYLVTAYRFLIGKRESEKPALARHDLENLATILEPIAKDSAAQVIISGTHNNTVVNNITINSVEANAAQNTARREIESMREPTKRDHEKVLMYFYQARDDAKSDKGDRAKIESIAPSSVKVVFADEHLKERALGVEHGPFKCAYVVDVSVETIEGRPALYRVTAIHDMFDRPAV